MPADLDLRECTFFIFVGDNPEVCIRRRQDVRKTRDDDRYDYRYEDREEGCDDEGLEHFEQDDEDEYRYDDEDDEDDR
jgi:hypothetical protein